MALRTPDFNPAQAKVDTARNLNDAEEKVDSVDTEKSVNELEKDPVNPVDPDNPMNYKHTGNNSSGKDRVFSKANLKKKSATIAIILVVAGGGLGIGGISLPALLPMSVLANLANKFNIETSWNARSNAMLVSKLTSNTTQGCQIVTIFCKFTRPSSRFLSQLEKNGIQAFDGDVPIVAKSILNPFSNTRPTRYVFTDSAGNKIESTAKTLSGDIAGNPEFRAALHSASMSRLMSTADSVATSVLRRFGGSFTDKLKGANNEEDVSKKIGSELDAEGGAIRSAAEEGGVLAEEEVKTLLNKEVDTTVKKLGKVGRGGLISLAGSSVCIIADAPKLITKSVRAFRMAQLIKYSMVFLSAFGAIKAGDATPAEASAIGDELTKVVDGKSAMDSFGMNYAITGATKPSNDNYKKFIPTSTVSSNLEGYNKAVNNKAKTGACDAVASPAFAEGINIALGDAGVLPALGNLALGYALGKVIEFVAPTVMKAIVSIIPTEKILGWFLGDFTANVNGEQVGDAITSGASHIMGQTANAGGNMPLTPEDAVAYENMNKQVQLAYAEEDRATLSPFDISSPNTMLGSIVQKIMPYYISAGSTVGSITHSFSFISNLVMGSFGAALQPITVGAESADTSQYQLCDDPALDKVAAGPYCNIIYGVPVQYLGKSPTDVLNALGSDVDQYTGEPKEGSDLASWVALCTDGTTDAAEGCKITDSKTANYALYTIDHRIQQSLDGPDTTTETTAP